MLVNCLEDIEKFNAVVNECEGNVYLKSIHGDVYNLKSALTRYIAIADLIRDEAGCLELFADHIEDEQKLLGYLNDIDYKG